MTTNTPIDREDAEDLMRCITNLMKASAAIDHAAAPGLSAHLNQYATAVHAAAMLHLATSITNHTDALKEITRV